MKEGRPMNNYKVYVIEKLRSIHIHYVSILCVSKFEDNPINPYINVITWPSTKIQSFLVLWLIVARGSDSPQILLNRQLAISSSIGIGGGVGANWAVGVSNWSDSVNQMADLGKGSLDVCPWEVKDKVIVQVRVSKHQYDSP